MRQIQAGGVEIKPEHFDIVRQMKEQMCHVALDYDTESYSRDDILTQEQRSYELPNGDVIEVGM